MTSPLQPAAQPLTRFIAVSVLAHLCLILALFSGLLDAKIPPALRQSMNRTRIEILSVLPVAPEALPAGNYTLPPGGRPVVVSGEGGGGRGSYSYPDTSSAAPPAQPESGVRTAGIGEAGSEGGGTGGTGGTGGEGGGGGPGKGEGGIGAQGKYEPPVPVVMMWPRYPDSAKRNGIRGKVVVRVHVTTEGAVDVAEVLSGLKDEACRRAALEAARALRFLPATLDGKPVDAWFSYPVEFGRVK